jgi:hypothetical protein
LSREADKILFELVIESGSANQVEFESDREYNEWTETEKQRVKPNQIIWMRRNMVNYSTVLVREFTRADSEA